ncbi:MAG: hypothetical protein NTW80_03440 [Deltaproteobacteria bacterium]|nr:hypothetical protein [Deltaproteobacteria bacterium]
MRQRLFLSIPLLLSVLCGCGLFTAKPEAEALVTRYFSALKSGAFQEAVPLFSEKYYQEVPKEELVKNLEKICNKFGTLEKYQQVSFRIDANTSRGGTLVILVYQVKYSHYEAQETFVILKPLARGPASIISHAINSKGSSGSIV